MARGAVMATALELHLLNLAHNPWHARAFRNGAWTTANATFVFDSISYDPNGNFNTGTGIYTCPVSGLYVVNSMLRYTATAVTQWMNLTVLQNGSGVDFGPVVGAASTGASVATGIVTSTVSCNAGDTLAISEGVSNVGLTGATGTGAAYLEITFLKPK